MSKREFSAGGIVVRNHSQGFKILLIKDAYGRWSWPKGKIDPGEKSEQAALREIEEEVGLTQLRILAKVGRSNYFYRLKGELIFKTVFFFLVQARAKQKLKVQTKEIKAARWFSPQQAKASVEYKGAKELLTKAIKIYKGLGNA